MDERDFARLVFKWALDGCFMLHNPKLTWNDTFMIARHISHTRIKALCAVATSQGIIQEQEQEQVITPQKYRGE